MDKSMHCIRGFGRSQSLAWNSHLHRCPWCRKKRGLTHVELYSVDRFDRERRGYPLLYPSEGRFFVAVASHVGCGPDMGYAIPLDELAADPNGWYRQILEKTWAPPELKDVIYDALLLHRKEAYPRFTPRMVAGAVRREREAAQRYRAALARGLDHHEARAYAARGLRAVT